MEALLRYGIPTHTAVPVGSSLTSQTRIHVHDELLYNKTHNTAVLVGSSLTSHTSIHVHRLIIHAYKSIHGMCTSVCVFLSWAIHNTRINTRGPLTTAYLVGSVVLKYSLMVASRGLPVSFARPSKYFPSPSVLVGPGSTLFTVTPVERWPKVQLLEEKCAHRRDVGYHVEGRKNSVWWQAK